MHVWGVGARAFCGRHQRAGGWGGVLGHSCVGGHGCGCVGVATPFWFLVTFSTSALFLLWCPPVCTMTSSFRSRRCLVSLPLRLHLPRLPSHLFFLPCPSPRRGGICTASLSVGWVMFLLSFAVCALAPHPYSILSPRHFS